MKKINFKKICCNLPYLIIIAAAIATGAIILFLNNHFLKPLISVPKLNEEIKVETIDLKKFNQLFERLEIKTKGQEIGQSKNPF